MGIKLPESGSRPQGSVKQKWGRLTDDDLDVIAGQRDVLAGKIQERYGVTREAAQKEIETGIISLPPLILATSLTGSINERSAEEADALLRSRGLPRRPDGRSTDGQR